MSGSRFFQIFSISFQSFGSDLLFNQPFDPIATYGQSLDGPFSCRNVQGISMHEEMMTHPWQHLLLLENHGSQSPELFV